MPKIRKRTKESHKSNRRAWIPPTDVFLPNLRNYSYHAFYLAEAGFELSVTEGLRHCLYKRQWDEGLQLVTLLHQLNEPPFELLWKAGMACLRGKVHEEEEKLQSNPYLRRSYPRNILTDYLTSLFSLPNSEPFHVLLNYELALHLLYVHEDPIQADDFLENLIYSHPYSELPYFLLLKGLVDLYLAQLSFQQSSMFQSSPSNLNEPNTPSHESSSSFTSSFFLQLDPQQECFLGFHSDTIRHLKKAKSFFAKLKSLNFTSLDWDMYLAHYQADLTKFIDFFKSKGVWDEDEKDLNSLSDFNLLPTSTHSDSPDPSPSLSPSEDVTTDDNIESFLDTFDFPCSDEKKWKKLVLFLKDNIEQLETLFSFRKSWWFPFHFSNDSSDIVLLTYKSIIAYWVMPEAYCHIRRKLWRGNINVPKKLYYILKKLDLKVRDISGNSI